jgi:uncharacterized protein
MAYDFLEIAATPSVKAAQQANGSRAVWEKHGGDRPSVQLSQDERDFITARDSFYIATVSETGWPYVQHRGGPAGFLKVLDDKILAFADFRGNRQYITVGNVAANDRAALFLMDYPNRQRLKIYARIELRDLSTDPALAEKLALTSYRARPERAMVLHIEAFDWNCPQHITPRFTEAEIGDMLTPLRARIDALTAENAALRAQLAVIGKTASRDSEAALENDAVRMR